MGRLDKLVSKTSKEPGVLLDFGRITRQDSLSYGQLFLRAKATSDWSGCGFRSFAVSLDILIHRCLLAWPANAERVVICASTAKRGRVHVSLVWRKAGAPRNDGKHKIGPLSPLQLKTKHKERGPNQIMANVFPSCRKVRSHV